MSEGTNRKLPGTTFSPVHWSWEPQCTVLQKGERTDGRHDDANSPRSAKNRL